MSSPRQRLIDAGIRLLEDVGPEALQARKVAAEVGVSTMAVYHHFGGMTGLLEQIAREAMIRFGRHMSQVPRSDDPVADLMALGLAYRDYALANRQRYRLMFGATAPGTGRLLGRANPVLDTRSPTGEPALDSAYEQLIDVVRRSMAAGRIRHDDAITVAGQIWSAVHGYVLLEISGVFGDDDAGVFTVLAPMTVNLLVGLGDERDAAIASALVVAAGVADQVKSKDVER